VNCTVSFENELVPFNCRIWCRKQKWMGYVLWHDGLLHEVLHGRMLGKRTRDRRRIQLINNLLEVKNYTDLKKAAENRNIGPASRADN